MKSLFSLSLLLTVVACSDGRSGDKKDVPSGNPLSTSATAPVVGLTNQGALSVNFAALVQGEELKCFDKSPAMLAQGQIFTDVRLFISNISFVNDQGEDIRVALDVEGESANLQYLDATNNSIALLNYLEAGCAGSDATGIVKSSIEGTLPYGRYTSLKFQIGLPYPAADAALTKIPAP